MKRILALALAAAMSVAAFGEVAISVDGDVVTKKDVLALAYKVFAAKQNANLSQSEEAEIIRNVFIDLEFWRIAATEVKGLNLNARQLLKDVRSSGFMERSEYVKLDRGAALNEATAVVIAVRLMNLTPRTIQASGGIRSLRDQFIARYARNHNVKLADYSAWKINRHHGAFVQGSDYNAIEEELDEDSNGFVKALYYVHRYTIRYYVMFLRWYVEKANSVIDHYKGSGSEKTTRWATITMLFIIPYLFHVILLLTYVKLRNRRPFVFRVMVKAVLLMGVSVLLFFFGMSPWTIFVVFVALPLGMIFIFPEVIKTTTQKTVYKRDEYGVEAERGVGYTADGERVSIGGDDIAYDAKYTDARKPGAETFANRVDE